ncbi:hypothetical protein [Novosphingobium rosa]|jgi:hypothetical protein|uniref:hypothetical protein n=1 Tax=Novosphingobium rosa TaxID=76978 RepID=UPI00083362ED|nr:hypothetical protein [Novosphingobium rosa]
MVDQKREGPLGDVIPTPDAPDLETPGSQKPEKTEDRSNVGQVTPEDYPEADRAKIDPDD